VRRPTAPTDGGVDPGRGEEPRAPQAMSSQSPFRERESGDTRA